MKTRKKREKTGGKWARYRLKGVATQVGAEDTGISARVIEALEPSRGDAVVYVPLAGTYHSLNVATALAIAMHEYRRQWPGEDTRRA